MRDSADRTICRRKIGYLIIPAVLAGAVFLWTYQHQSPKRNALATLGKLDEAMSSKSAGILALVVIPPSMVAQSENDQGGAIRDLLKDEVSPAGLKALKKGSVFGPLADVFPEEGKRWADNARVPLADCVAFRMERNNIRAEVVLHQTPAGYRILRCNNVKQMASKS
jgi:hypothetical protein